MLNKRGFDPANFDAVDECRFDESAPLVEHCPVCGAENLVFNYELWALVDLNGERHECPEEA